MSRPEQPIRYRNADPFDNILRAVPKGCALVYSPATRTFTVEPMSESLRAGLAAEKMP